MDEEQERYKVQAENVQLHTIQPRMRNPGAVIPEANTAIQDLIKATYKGGVSPRTLELVHLRASQINGCSFCVGSSANSVQQKGESVERLLSVAAWREAPYFTDAERAALALTEAVTRLADRSDAVPDAIWDEATKYYDEREMAALLLWIATTNLFNHLNVPTRQPAGVQSW
jgi:AhpD family alkylhydroperoxidase